MYGHTAGKDTSCDLSFGFISSRVSLSTLELMSLSGVVTSFSYALLDESDIHDASVVVVVGYPTLRISFTIQVGCQAYSATEPGRRIGFPENIVWSDRRHDDRAMTFKSRIAGTSNQRGSYNVCK